MCFPPTTEADPEGPPAATTHAPDSTSAPQSGPGPIQFVMKSVKGQLVSRVPRKSTRTTSSGSKSASLQKRTQHKHSATPSAISAPPAPLTRVNIGPDNAVDYSKYNNIFPAEVNFLVPVLSDSSKSNIAYYLFFVDKFFIYSVQDLESVTRIFCGV